MTDPERDHFVQQIRDLERRLRRSWLVITTLAVFLVIPLVGGGLLALVVPTFMARERAALRAAQEHAAEQAARAALAEARARAAEAEAARQKDLAEKARREAGKPSGPGKD